MRHAVLSVKFLFLGLLAALLVACNPIAVISYSPTEPAANEEVEFDGTGTLISNMPTGAAAVAYEWDFGDGKTARGATVTHTYTRAGTFRVTLTVTDSAGRSGTSSEDVTVQAADPNATSSSTTDESTDTTDDTTTDGTT
ncbi:MAG: PKD domain-containing protein [Burkholderiaceae bacterium]